MANSPYQSTPGTLGSGTLGQRYAPGLSSPVGSKLDKPANGLGSGRASDHIYLRPSQVRDALLTCIRAREPVMLWGDPGIGKTSIVGQVARELYGGADPKQDADAGAGRDTDYFLKCILSQREPADALGLMFPKEGKDGIMRTKWTRPDFFPVHGEGIFFLDEMAQAVGALQAPARQLLTERQFGPHRIGDGWAVVAASNYPHNRAGANRLLTHVGSSLIHIHVIPDVDDWLTWAMASGGIGWQVTGYLKFRGDRLHVFSSDTDTFPCPRQWAKVSRLVEAEPPRSVAHALYAGAVGEGDGGEFAAWMDVCQHMPDVNECLNKPKTAPVPTEDSLGTLYALTSALARRVTGKNWGNVLTYLDRLPMEFGTYAVKTALRRGCKDECRVEHPNGEGHLQLSTHPQFVKWCLERERKEKFR